MFVNRKVACSMCTMQQGVEDLKLHMFRRYSFFLGEGIPLWMDSLILSGTYIFVIHILYINFTAC
jgi:hypothetical protein